MASRWGLARAALGAALLVAPGASRAQCTTPAGETGFAEATFDFGSGTFAQVLPFDVPVRICTAAPDGTLRGTVYYVVTPQRGAATEVEPGTCTIAAPAGRAWTQTLTRDANGGAIRWVLAPLAAERYYTFCFRTEKQATEAQLTDFRQRALLALDAALARVTSAEVTREQAQAMCEDLRAALLEVTAADEVIRGDSILADCGSADLDRFVALVNRGPLQAQRRAQVILEGVPNADPRFAAPAFGQRQGELQAALAALQADPSVKTLVGLVERLSALDPTAAGQVTSLCGACTALVGPGAIPAGQLASGQGAALTPVPPLSLRSDTDAASAAAQAYTTLGQQLAGLSRLLSWAVSDGAPAALGAGLGSADRAALADLARQAGPVDRAAGLADTLAGLTQSLATHLTTRAKGLQDLAGQLQVAATTVVLADASTLASFKTRSQNYVSLDAGLTWVPELEEVVPYLGTNVYFRPVNRDAPLASLGSFRQTFSRRFSLSMGLTASSIADSSAEGGNQDDLFGNQSLLLGAGLRITDAMRLGAGAIVFKQDDPDPLVDESKLNTSYYLSLSFDIDVVGLFAKPFRTALGEP